MKRQDKKIIKEDIIQLQEIAKIYEKQNKIAKAQECLKEAEELKQKIEVK